MRRALDWAEEVVARADSHLSEEVEEHNIRPRPAAAIARWLRVPARVAISGPSMLPTLEPGDHVLVRRTKRPRQGELVVFSDPQARRRLVVKRVAAARREGIEVVGDNPGASRDSKDFGLVAYADVLGVVWYRYAPQSRSGRVR